MAEMEMEKITLEMEEELDLKTPTLVLGEEDALQAERATPEIEPVNPEDMLSPEEKKQVEEFAEKINIEDTGMVLRYGSAAQKKVASFSESALERVRTKDLGEVGDAITDLVTELKGFDADAEEKGGFFGLFKRAQNKIASLTARYDKVEVNVDKIVDVLEGHQVQLLKDVALLDKMYQMNLSYYKELTMYILAGKRKLKQVEEEQLPKLQEKAKASGSAEDAQAANDLAQRCTNFDKKLHDLELTRMVSIQMGPQIRLVQSNDSMMVEKIQSTIVNTIPLWKSQMVLSLGIAHSQKAMEAQRSATNFTNELLRKNADTLKMGSIEAAKESERGIVDIETLKHTNQALISTLDEVMKIQEEGRQKRRSAEAELGRIEGELKDKLLQLRQS